MKAEMKLYQAALYMRLSKDDGAGESASIGTQRKMLRSYATENAFAVYDEYIDDGYSGTNFERPSFQRMILDIEAGHVNLVITKDLSRLGRDYIATGQYLELYFPEHGVRYIAMNDGYDSNSPYNDIAPFKNIINEMYARDASKKIRSAFTVKMKEGSFIGNFAPYGYRKDPSDKNHLLIDHEAALIVQEIFRRAEDGQRPADIAHALNQRGIVTPAVYRCTQHPNLDIDFYSRRKEWTSAMVCKMLRNIVYLGHMAQGKTTKASFKSSIVLANDQEDWFIVQNTHQPIVAQELFDTVRQRSVSRRNMPKGMFQNIFSGIAKCMDCGRNMSTTGTGGKAGKLVCGSYKLYGGSACSNHLIGYETLYDVVISDLRRHVCLTATEKQQILSAFHGIPTENDPICDAKKALKNLEKRTQELDRIIQRLYEDRIGEKLSEERFAKLLLTYEMEQKDLLDKIERLVPAVTEPPEESLLHYLQLINNIADLQTITPQVLRKLVNRIEVGQSVCDQEGNRRQTVRINYRFMKHLSDPSIT